MCLLKYLLSKINFFPWIRPPSSISFSLMLSLTYSCSRDRCQISIHARCFWPYTAEDPLTGSSLIGFYVI